MLAFACQTTVLCEIQDCDDREEHVGQQTLELVAHPACSPPPRQCLRGEDDVEGGSFVPLRAGRPLYVQSLSGSARRARWSGQKIINRLRPSKTEHGALFIFLSAEGDGRWCWLPWRER